MQEIRLITQSKISRYNFTVIRSETMPKIPLLMQSKSSRSGFTLIECIMAFLVLSIVLLSVLQAVNLAARANQLIENAYKAGMLLEGVMTEARLVSGEELSLLSKAGEQNIWKLIKNPDTSDAYDFTLYYKNKETGAEYTFTDNNGITLSAQASAEFLPASVYVSDDFYDIIIDEYIQHITVSDGFTDNCYIALTFDSDEAVFIENMGNADVFADICGDCVVFYKGAGTFTETRIGAAEPSLIVCASVYSKEGVMLNTITACN